MGTDPHLDWPHPPYRRDRSPIAVAAEHGFGTVNLDEIDFDMDTLQAPLAEFDSRDADPPERIAKLRHTACQQALFYGDNREQLSERYAGQYIYLQDGEVIWNGEDPGQAGNITEVSAAKKDEAAWLKLADPQEREGEHLSVYERILAA